MSQVQPIGKIHKIFGSPSLYAGPTTNSEKLKDEIPAGAIATIILDGDIWSEVVLDDILIETKPARGFVRTRNIEENEVIEHEEEKLGFEIEDPPVFRPMTGLIQKILFSKGFYPNHKPDSKFGLKTKLAVEEFQQQNSFTRTGVIDNKTGRMLGLTNWTKTYELELGAPYYQRVSRRHPRRKTFAFLALVPNGFFSHWPDKKRSKRNPLTPRAIRTNNPGAINKASWRRKIPGYVGLTQPDVDDNQTMIFTCPEYGIAAWKYWFTKVMFPGETSVRVGQVIKKYAGRPEKEHDYIVGFKTYSPPDRVLEPTVILDLRSDKDMKELARAQFSHETGFWYPLTDAQFDKGMQIAAELLEKEKSTFIAIVKTKWSDFMSWMNLDP